MKTALESIDAAMRELDSLRKSLKRTNSERVRATDDRALAKATALAWFNDHRPQMPALPDPSMLLTVDDQYNHILVSTEGSVLRSTYLSIVASLKRALVQLRSLLIAQQTSSAVASPSVDRAPDFSPLISDPDMQRILTNRWEECIRCIAGQAPLAAIVMMGGLLEALLLARVNADPNKAPVFRAKSAPRVRGTTTTLPLKEWTLRDFIDVAHELGWISKSAHDVGEVLRDYRNYVHPYKELAHAAELRVPDAALLWGVCKSLSSQIIASV